MPSQIITNFDVNDERLQFIYSETKGNYSNFQFQDLDIIFNIALQNKALFPAINMPSPPSINAFIARWVKGYVDARSLLPSQRISTPKTSCSDPAIRAIVQTSKDLSDENSKKGEKIHNIFMSAENIQGNLLEEFIEIKIHEFGWIWCCGNVMRSVDFCSSDGSKLLQIKNKSNTENSSSSAIRTGTDIEKWFRLGTRTVNGIREPNYKWSDLNNIINSHKTDPQKICNITEEDYIEFLRQVTLRNRQLINEN